MWASVGTLGFNSSWVSHLPGVTFKAEGCSGNNNQSCRTVHLMEDDNAEALEAEVWFAAFLV
jgi:hypothetical protein